MHKSRIKQSGNNKSGVPRKAPSALSEWGFSNKMLDLTRHIDKVRKA